MEVDVAIIGAGPAGALAALLLARRGLSVALLDRDTFPRDKVCGEFLSYDGVEVLDRLGLAARLDEAGATFIRRCRLFAHGSRIEFDLPAVARGLSRYRFDHLLVEEARAAGATVVEGAAVDSVTRESNGFALTCSNEEPQSLRCRVLLGAWGRWGRIDRQLQRPFVTNRSTRHFGFKRHYRATGDDETIELHAFQRGYLGVSNVEGGVTNICGLVHEQRISGLKGRWDAFTGQLAAESDELRELFATHEPVRDFLTSDPVIFTPKEPAEDGIYLLGDAAGMIDPLTGNGMSMALQSALIAAAHLPEALSGAATAEKRYAAAYRSAFASRLWWSRAAAALLERPAMLKQLLRMPALGKLAPGIVRRTRSDARGVDRLLRNAMAVRF
jgi:flavin-dependent dehydrogenase